MTPAPAFVRGLEPKGATSNAPFQAKPLPAPEVIGSDGAPSFPAPMLYRPLGRTGLRVSAISYGSWLTFSGGYNVKTVDHAEALMRKAINLGINFLDNAEVYGEYFGESERIMGEVLDRIIIQGDEDAGPDGGVLSPKSGASPGKAFVRRSDLVISTKLRFGGEGVNSKGLSRKKLVESMRKSLKRLRLEYVDLIFAHRFDPTTPMEEIVRAFNFLIDQGYCFYWGTSMWSAEEISRAHETAKRLGLVGPTYEQPQYNLLNRGVVEKEFETLYREVGLGLTVWSPLAQGVLAGRYLPAEGSSAGTIESADADSRAKTQGWKNSIDGENAVASALNELAKQLTEEVREKLVSVGNKAGAESTTISLAHLSLAWCLANDNVSTCIVGASKESQLEDNCRAIVSFHLLDWLSGGAPLRDSENGWRARVEKVVGDTVKGGCLGDDRAKEDVWGSVKREQAGNRGLNDSTVKERGMFK